MQLVIPDNVFSNWITWYGGQLAHQHRHDVIERTEQALDDWNLRATKILLGGGISLIVADEQQGKVVKVAPSGEHGSRHEATALHTWAGPGVLNVLSVHTNGAILLPYYANSMSASEHLGNDRLKLATVIGYASKLIHDRSPGYHRISDRYGVWEPYAFAHKEQFAHRWDDDSERLYEQIKHYCNALLATTEKFTLLHTDLTAWNILYTGNQISPYIIIDPKPAFGDRHGEIFGIQTLFHRHADYPHMQAAVNETLDAFTSVNGYDPQRCKQWLGIKAACHYLETLLQPDIPQVESKANLYQRLMIACEWDAGR